MFEHPFIGLLSVYSLKKYVPVTVWGTKKLAMREIEKHLVPMTLHPSKRKRTVNENIHVEK